MEVKVSQIGNYQTNCYIVLDKNARDGIIIDPGDDNKALDYFIDNCNVNIKAILLTHGHIDHTGGVKYLNDKFNIPVYINEKDAELMYKNTDIFGSLPEKREVIYLNDKEELNFGNIEVSVISTPGHTPGGICFKIQDILFSGDTLFEGSIGRTDLVGGDFETLMSSIFNKLLILNNDIKICPGHGGMSSIGQEKTHNRFLNS